MKIFSYILCLFILTSCKAKKDITFNLSEIEKIEGYQGYPGTRIQMKNNFEREFIKDMNNSKDNGPTKYIKTHSFLIHHKSGEIDTILTNGTIHQYKGWFRSKQDLIKKYSVEQEISFSDSIQEQLKTAEKINDYMGSKKYEEAIQLFSLKQIKNIKEIKKDSELFAIWCWAWTFDDAKYDRYLTKIKEGKAHFVFENNEWKINEK
jgi:hypothetical protein